MTGPGYLLACVVASVAVFFLAHVPQSRESLLLRFDAVGLALFAVLGADKALAVGAGPVAAVAMGVVTATLGGVVRDVLSGESPAILSREIYATAALAGAVVFVPRGRRAARDGDVHWFRRGRRDPLRGPALELVAASLPPAFRRHVTAVTRPRRPCFRTTAGEDWPAIKD